MQHTSKSQLAIIFLTVFIYLLGFGMIIPIIPILSREFGADSLQSGFLMSVFSLAQFLFAPLWGKLSDRFGRRPILLLCLFGEGLSYLLFASARTLEMLFVARTLTGFFGASIATSSAYIADITGEANRSKGMALIGTAFGLGFLFGPVMGGLLSHWGSQISSEPHFATSFSAVWVSGICFATLIFAYFYLDESLKIKSTSEKKYGWQYFKLWNVLRQKTVGPLIGIYFALTLAMASMESTLIYYVADSFGWGVKENSYGMGYIGIFMILTQGFLVRKLLPKLGERKILMLGILMFTFGMSGLAWGNNLTVLAFTMPILAIGLGFSNPSIMGSISVLSKDTEQGSTMGVSQSMSSMGRILGPIAGGALYRLQWQYSFWFSTLVGLFAFFLFINISRSIPSRGKAISS